MQAFEELERAAREVPRERARWAEQERLVRLARHGSPPRPGPRRALALLLRALALGLDSRAAERCGERGPVGLAGSHK